MTADKISTCRLNPAADVTRTITLATVSLPSRTHVPHYQPAAAAADDTVDACIKVTSSDVSKSPHPTVWMTRLAA